MKILSLLTAALLFVPLAANARVLVWDHDGGQSFHDPDDPERLVGSERAVEAALANLGVAGVERKYVLPLNLEPYEAVFVLCGFWPGDGRLSYSEQQTLANYLASGGNLYLEGTELARRYGGTPLFRKAGVRFEDDGRPLEEGNVNVAEGIGPWRGISLTYYSYRTDSPDAYVDELGLAGGEVVVRSRRAGNRSNARVVRYAATALPEYRVIVSSFIFGALENGKHTRADLMGRYAGFFGLTAPPNKIGVAPTSLGRVRALFR
ncbi:MAG: hypothetical protein JSU81_01525 [Candidatus Coatesbacteria bacterium]|nr:MAG: hypothetical protein JSU81_01525 [Candidatus Coatesbacteria bacterium]